MLPVLNVNIFRSVFVTPTPAASPKDLIAETLSPLFEMAVRKHGITATAQEVDGEFVVRAGSLARSSWSGRASNYQRLHQNLVDEGILEATGSGELAAFTRDYPFLALRCRCHRRGSQYERTGILEDLRDRCGIR